MNPVRATRPRQTGVRQVPTILQMEAVECGAASLAMVMAYHGRWVPLETLREACGVSRDGTKASNMLRAARMHGMVPALMRAFIDEVVVAREESWLNPLLISVGLAAMLRGVATWLQGMALARLNFRLAVLPGGQFLWHMLRLPLRFHAQRHAGEVVARIKACDRVAQLLSGDLARTALNVMTIAFFGLTLLAYDGPLALVVFGFGLLSLMVIGWGSRRQREASAEGLAERGRLGSATVSLLSGIETIKAGALERETFARWAGRQARVLDASRRLGLLSLPATVLPSLLTALASAAVLGLGSWRAMRGDLTVGDIVAVQTLTAGFLAPVGQIVALGGVVRAARADLARLNDALAIPALPMPDPVPEAPLQGAIELDAVSFGYSPLDPPLLESISIRVRPGTRVALVGASGSGKSTLARLIGGLLEPRSGHVRLDGRPLAEIGPMTRARGLGYVDQDIRRCRPYR